MSVSPGKLVVSMPRRSANGGHRQHLRGSKNLPESLVFAEEVGAILSVVARQHDRTADRSAELIAIERWYAATVQFNVVEVIARVERSVAEELEQAAMDRIRSRLGHHVGETCGPVTDFGQHHAGTRLHFLDGIDIEGRERSATHFRIGGVGSVHGKDRGHAALTVDGKLLREIRSSVGVGHGARRQQEQLAEIAGVQRQARHLRSREVLSSASLRSCRSLPLPQDETGIRYGQLQICLECGAFRDDQGLRRLVDPLLRNYCDFIGPGRNR